MWHSRLFLERAFVSQSVSVSWGVSGSRCVGRQVCLRLLASLWRGGPGAQAFHECFSECVCDYVRILRLQSVRVCSSGRANYGMRARDLGDECSGVSARVSVPQACPCTFLGSAARPVLGSCAPCQAGPAVRARVPSCVRNACSTRAGYLCPSSQECAACASGCRGVG